MNNSYEKPKQFNVDMSSNINHYNFYKSPNHLTIIFLNMFKFLRSFTDLFAVVTMSRLQETRCACAGERKLMTHTNTPVTVCVCLYVVGVV